MKNAIIQLYIPFNGVGKDILKSHYPKELPDWVECSVESVQRYANNLYNVGTHFYREKFVKSSSNFFDKLRVYLDPSLDEYDQILYLDCDILVKNKFKNIFEEIKRPYDVAAVPEFPHDIYAVPVNWNRSPPLESRFANFKAPMVKPKSIKADYRMFNSGVMLWSKEGRIKARQNFIDHELWFNYKNPLLDSSLKNVGHSSHCLDQPFFNAMFNRFEFRAEELGIYWNRFPCKEESTPCGFAHYVQDYRFKMPSIWNKIK